MGENLPSLPEDRREGMIMVDSHIGTLVAIGIAFFAAAVVPGSNFALVAGTAVACSRSSALAAAFGIVTGTLIWSTAAMLGLAAVITQVDWLRTLMILFGSIYLLYLGVSLLVASKPGHVGLADERSDDQSGLRSFYLKGLLNNLTNPKSPLFYMALQAGVIQPDTPMWVKFGAILTMVLIAAVWHPLVALVFSEQRLILSWSGLKRSLSLSSGLVLCILAFITIRQANLF